MGNYENIKNKGFDNRTTRERRELAIKAGKASGEARRKKADFRNTLNQLLTAKIENPEWTPILEALGLDSTLESALNMAMIKEGLAGNVKAYEAIAKYSGQDDKSNIDIQNIAADIALKEARKQDITGENENDDALQKLDEILKGVKEHAARVKSNAE